MTCGYNRAGAHTIYIYHLLNVYVTLYQFSSTQRKMYTVIQVNIIYFNNIISLYIRKYITSSPQALNLIVYILNFSKCSILVKNIKTKIWFAYYKELT